MAPAAERSLSRGALALGCGVAAWLALALGWPASALAHEVGLSRGEYTLQGATVTAELTFAQREVAWLAPELDADHDEVLSAAELQRGATALTRSVVERIVVEGDGKACLGKLASAGPVEGDGAHLSLIFACDAPPREVRFDLPLLEELPYGHRHIFRSGEGAALTESILYRKRRSIQVLSPPAGAAPGAPAVPEEGPSGAAPSSGSPAERPEATGTLDFFKMGLEHILLGFDHLVFLLGLVLVGGRWRSILLVITAFTVAHSITLGLAVLGIWAPSPRFVEPAIALSIAYVGVENFFVTDAEKRWQITFPFGLVHGFGFAGALQEIALPRADLPGALLAFNLGVEAGQLAVLAAVLPLMALARRGKWLAVPSNEGRGSASSPRVRTPRSRVLTPLIARI
jgi:hydrogenase/urease accessory protein HupE